MQQTIRFVKATKHRARLRLLLEGLGKSGKTYTSLKIATELGRRLLNREPRIAVLDSEGGSALKYADEFDFDHFRLVSCSPESYVQALELAAREGYDFIILDSLSHEWIGRDGALALVDQVSKRSQSNNQFFAWREVTPLHDALIEAILNSPLHIIATVRVKAEWVIEADAKGKMVPRKHGTTPVQRDGIDYEFDVVGKMTREHDMIIDGTRCSGLDSRVFRRPGADVAEILAKWLSSGAEPPPRPIDPIQTLMEDAAVKKLFDALGATEAKRRITAEKYPDRETLIARLKATLNDGPTTPATARPRSGRAHRPAAAKNGAEPDGHGSNPPNSGEA